MSKQNIAIIILSALLILSLGFGATYAYFSGSSDQLVSGYITTAVLNVELDPLDTLNNKLDKTSFELEMNSKKNIIPGQPLSNTALQVTNTSPVPTYMMVVYTLQILEKLDNAPDKDIPDASKMEAMNIQEDAVGDGWRMVAHTCNDGSTIISSLVYLGDNGNGNGVCNAATTNPDGSVKGVESKVLSAGCLMVPPSWDNKMQGAKIRLTFTAYILQVEGLSINYPQLSGKNFNDLTGERKAEVLADVMIKEHRIDTTQAAG